MPFIISFVGKSNSGKTTLLEKLIAELKKRGYRLGVIKHSFQEVELDTPGKDSWRMAQAGSDAVGLSSGGRFMLTRKVASDTPLERLAGMVGDVDILLAEGFKGGMSPKIEVHRREQGKDLVSPPEHLFALVTDEPMQVSIPQYTPDDISGIATLIEQTYLARSAEEEVMVTANDTSVYLKPYVEETFARVLMALVSTLKGVGDMKNVEVVFRRKAGKKKDGGR